MVINKVLFTSPEAMVEFSREKKTSALVKNHFNICDPSREKGAYENFTIRLISPSQP